MRLTLKNLDDPDVEIGIDAPSGEKLSRAIWLSGRVRPASLCGGLARCGRCKAILPAKPPPTDEERGYFSPEDLERGWRLTCRRLVDNDAEIWLPGENFQTDSLNSQFIAATDATEVLLAVDLGTTTIEWRAFGDDQLIASGKFPNPQGGAGADVLSRLDDAPRMMELIRDALNEVVAGFAPRGVDRLCVAANSVMTEIFLGDDVSGLRASPPRLARAGGEVVDVALESGRFPIVIPPLLSPFVGGDASAALLACADARLPMPFLTIDLGTNAEFLLLKESGELFAASVPMGPALEGMGTSRGATAGPGAVVSFRLTPNGLTSVAAPGATPRGISATGYLSLLSILRGLTLMDEAGQFASLADSALAARVAAEIFPGGATERAVISADLFVDREDIQQLLKAKAAFAVAVKKLLELARVAPGDLARVCLTGALGVNARADDLVALGFLPPICAERIVAMENAALAGASILVREPAKLAELDALRRGATLLVLTDDPDFFKAYLSAMRWVY